MKRTIALIALIVLVAAVTFCILRGCSNKSDTITTTTTTTTDTTTTTTEEAHKRSVDEEGSVHLEWTEENIRETDYRHAIIEEMKNGAETVFFNGTKFYNNNNIVYVELPGESQEEVFDANTGWDYPYSWHGDTCRVTFRDKKCTACVMENSFIIFSYGEEVYRTKFTDAQSIEYSNEHYVLVLANKGRDEYDRGDNFYLSIFCLDNESWYDVKMPCEGVIDVSASYGTIWLLSKRGEVYASTNRWWDWDGGYTANPKFKKLADNAIALSDNMSDAAGWFVPGEVSPIWSWAKEGVRGKFVSAWDVWDGEEN